MAPKASEKLIESRVRDLLRSRGYDCVQVRPQIKGLRDLRAGLLEAATTAGRPGETEIADVALVALDHAMSGSTMKQVWDEALSALRPEIADHLTFFSLKGPTVTMLGRASDSSAKLALESLLEEWRGQHGAQLHPVSRPEIHYLVLKALVTRWLLHEPAVTRKELAAEVGCSYPSLARSLEPLEPYLVPHRNRSVELAQFPASPWSQLLALSERVRTPLHFKDATGVNASPEDLFERLRRRVARFAPDGLGDRVAVGGTMAARFWDADFDLTGDLQLHLVVKGSDDAVDLSFLSRADPGLVMMPSDASSPPPRTLRSAGVHGLTRVGKPAVVVHPLHRAKTYFVPDVQARPFSWADPTEVLLDLYELGLPEQADALIQRLRRRGESTPGVHTP